MRKIKSLSISHTINLMIIIVLLCIKCMGVISVNDSIFRNFGFFKSSNLFLLYLLNELDEYRVGLLNILCFPIFFFFWSYMNFD